MARNLREMTLVFDGRLGSGLKNATGETIKRLDSVNANIKQLQAAKLDAGKFVALKQQVGKTEQAFEAAQADVARLAREMRAAENPSKRLTSQFARAKTEAGKLKEKLGSERTELERLRRSLSGAGISTANLAGDTRRLDLQLGAAGQEVEALRRRLQKLEGQERRNAAAAAGMGQRMRASVGAMVKGGVGALAAYVAVGQLTSGYKDLTGAAMEESRAQARLDQLMMNVANTRKSDVAGIIKYSAALQKVTTIGDDVSVSGASQLATYQLQSKNIKALMPALANLAVGTYGVNVSQEQMIQSANMMGKVFTGQVGVLRRVGITFTKAQEKILKTGTQSEKTAMLIKVMDQNYGGLAKRLATTDEGKLAQIRNLIGDMKEELGNELLPVQAKVLGYLAKNLPAIKNLFMGALNAVKLLGKGIYAAGAAGVAGFKWYQKNLSWLTPIILGAAAGFAVYRGALLVAATAQKIVTAAQWAWNVAMNANPIGLIITGIGALIGVIYLLVKNWDKVKAAGMAVWNWFVKFATEGPGRFIPFIAAIGLIAKNWDKVKAVLLAVWNALKRVWDMAKNFTGKIWGGITSVAGKLGIGGKPAKHARGGIVHHPTLSWVGERGPEAIIPLSGHKNRAAALWESVGQSLGMGGAGINVSYAPTVNISGNADRGVIDAALSRANEDLERRLAGLMRDRERRSMA